jgi:hypothetical protein
VERAEENKETDVPPREDILWPLVLPCSHIKKLYQKVYKKLIKNMSE